MPRKDNIISTFSDCRPGAASTITASRPVVASVVSECGVNPPPAPVATAATGITSSGFTANWNASAGADDYFLDVATDALFLSLVVDNLAVGAALTSPATGLNPDTDYYYRVRARSSGGVSANSNTITLHTAVAYLLQDEFNGGGGTSIKAHQPDIPTAPALWVDAAGYAGSVNTTLDGAGNVSPNLVAGFANGFDNPGVSVANVAVEIGQGAGVGAGSGVGFGLDVRAVAAPTETRYRLHRNTTAIEFYRVIAGGSTLLASYTLAGLEIPSSANFVIFWLEVITLGNGNPRLTLKINGVQRLQYEDSNVSKITAAGRIGFRFFKVAGETPVLSYIHAVAA